MAATYDACVLYPAGLRDLLIRLAQTGLVRARWSDAILDEMSRSILANRPDLSVRQIERTRRLMCEAVADCMTTGHEPLIERLELPDPDDRHVLAAAIHAETGVIVTSNIKDFPSESLAPFSIRAETPDTFVSHLIDAESRAVRNIVNAQAAALKNPPMTFEELVDRFEQTGLVRSAAALRGG